MEGGLLYTLQRGATVCMVDTALENLKAPPQLEEMGELAWGSHCQRSFQSDICPFPHGAENTSQLESSGI